MLYQININNDYNSSKLLFSIPVHENQEIINNQIENILNYNPNAKIIIHVNKSFLKNFDLTKTNYENVYVNSKSFNYTYSKGLLWIHINNFLEAITLNLDFNYFIILSSNEMFIKHGLNLYIETYKNGAQIIEYDINNLWHNFHKNLEKDEKIIKMLEYIGLNCFYGGQTEGQFYEKVIFQKISDIYLNFFGTLEINNFETEEIISQTIFKSFNIEYGLPFTLQNYSNKMDFTEDLIENIRANKIIVEHNKTFKEALESAHSNKDCSSVYSIKRVERTFNNIRNLLSRKGFILNKELFQLNSYYYSNYSKLLLYSFKHLHFKKNSYNSKKSFNWFGYEIDIGSYIINFDIKTNLYIRDIINIGLKIHYPYEIIYNFFFENLEINKWKNVKFTINIKNKDYLIFIFDDYFDNIDIEIKNMNIKKIKKSNKNNIALVLYENSNSNTNSKNSKRNNYDINYTNINEMIIKPFSEIYDTHIFSSLFDYQKRNLISNLYKQNDLIFLDKNDNINNIFIKSIDQIIKFKNEINIDYDFFIFFRLDSIFKKNVSKSNFYIKKFNFISYHIPYIDGNISNSYEFISIPNKYILDFYNLINNNINNENICNLIYNNLSNNIDKNNFNFMFDDNYIQNVKSPLIKYLNTIEGLNDNKGYIFNKKYLYDIYYKNNYSKFLKNSNNEFYFYKNKTNNYKINQWVGLYIDNLNDSNKTENIIVKFSIKILKELNINISNFGLKTHDPLNYYKDWINDCVLDNYVNIKINLAINSISQYIILNFDNYLNEVEFYIKDFEIIMEYFS